MTQEIKNFLSSLSKKRVFVFFFVFLILFGFLFPIQPAQAQLTLQETIMSGIFPGWLAANEAMNFVMGWGGDLAERIGTYLVSLVFTLLGTIAMGFAGLAIAILNYVVSPNFISLSYTQRTNPIIDAGLNVTQGFVNMILVLILVYIALATILRLTGYETKKLLVTFVVVALLVNFAPVICGLIVDASNIVMNYFLKNISTFLSFSDKLAVLWGGFLNAPPWAEKTERTRILAQSVVMTVFGAFAGLIFLLFAVVFLVRYIAIWVLVILSPLAFACYILPVTKKYWTQWWTQFLQWSFIGVTMGFFLYLAAILLSKAESIFKAPALTNVESQINVLFVYLVPLAFLYLGFIIGLSTSAMGASTVMGLTKRAGGWVGGKTFRGAKTWVEEKTRLKEATGKTVKAVESIPIARWFIPETVRKYGEQRPAVEEAEKELDTHSSPHIVHRILANDIYGVKAVAGMSKLVGRGDFQDFFKGAKDKYKVKSDAELYQIPEFRNKMTRLMQIAANSGKIQPIVRGDPRLAGFAAGIGPYKGMTEEKAIEKATIESRRNHIANWEPEVLENKTVVNALLTKGRESFEAIDSQVKRGMETTLGSIDKMFSEFVDKNKGKLPPGADLWKEFREEIKKQHPDIELKGYFTALDDKRFQARGWREGRYLTTEQRERTPSVAPTAPLTPGAAAGLKPKQAPAGPPEAPKGYAGPGIKEVPPKRPRGRGGVGV